MMDSLTSVIERNRLAGLIRVPLIGLLLWAALPVSAATQTISDETSDDAGSTSLVLMRDAGGAPVRLEGDGVTSHALNRLVKDASGQSLALVVRGHGVVSEDRLQPRLGSAGRADAALPIDQLMSWLEQSAAERLLLVFDLAGAPGLCQLGEPDRLLASKPRLALLCVERTGKRDAEARPSVAEVAIERLSQNADGVASPTAFGLVRALKARADADSATLVSTRGKDWPIETAPAPTTAGASALDKLDTDLMALSAPDLDAAGLDALLARLDQAGVIVRREPPPAVTVRVTALSAEGVPGIRAEIERAGGTLGVVFDNTVFALIPVARLRHLAGLDAVWTLEVNRMTLHPIGGR